jgi:hypothetical protein
MRNSPLPFAPPEICLELSRNNTLIFGFGVGALKTTHEKISKDGKVYLTPCCVLEVQKPTQALKLVEGPRNTID